ncbi:MAG: sigma-70 family RNA polymerase sigma factor [Oscillospiraceae bacterium]|nr:sigma-70 family RNA polymerase sigma factor [Oscillospiraceae bacterium]
MKKEYYITIDGKDVPVTEEVYRAFKRPAWTERKRREIRSENERSLEAFTDDGFDIPSEQALVDELVEDKLLLDMLSNALLELTDDERDLINALFYEEKSERELSKDTGVPHPTIHSRKVSVLQKLKRLLEEKL